MTKNVTPKSLANKRLFSVLNEKREEFICLPVCFCFTPCPNAKDDWRMRHKSHMKSGKPAKLTCDIVLSDQVSA